MGKKYEISEEDYDKREKTVRNYKREQLKKDPNWKPKCRMDIPGKENKPAVPAPGPDSVEGMAVGNRCEVQPGARRGEVMYVGEAKGEGGLGAGHWIGVKFDEPLGKNDGSVKGVNTSHVQPSMVLLFGARMSLWETSPKSTLSLTIPKMRSDMSIRTAECSADVYSTYSMNM